MKRKNGIILLGALLVFALILAVAPGLMIKQKIWPNLKLDYVQGKQAFSLEQGDAYGVISSGPHYNLAAGRYRLQWRSEGDGVNRIRLSARNDVQIVPDQIEMVQEVGDAEFEILDAADRFSIQIEFCDGTWMNVHNLRLYSPQYTDNLFTAAALLFFCLIIMRMQAQGKLTQERREALILLAVAVMVSSLPVLRENSFYADDTQFHAARLYSIVDALEHGQFPARVGGFSYNGYGAVTSVYYPDLMLYPFAMMLKLGASLAYVINVLTITCNALCAACMYMAARHMLGGHREALFAAMLYTLSNFRIERVYDSLMLGYMIALALLPLFIWGLWEVFFGDRSRWPLLALGATLIFQSHLLTTVQCAAFAALLAVIYAKKLVQERRMGAVACAVAATLLINLFTIVPMLTTYLSGASTPARYYDIESTTLEPYQILGTHGKLGIAMILGLAAWLCGDREERRAMKERRLMPLMWCGIVCLWMSTRLFPWNYVMKAAQALMETFQFAWRFLTFPVLAFSLCAGCGYALITRNGGRRALLAVLALAVFCAMPRLTEEMENGNILEFGQGVSPYMFNQEYQFEGTDVIATRSRALLSEGEVQLTDYQKDGTEIRVQVDAQSDATLSFPLFGFDGYAAEIGGERIDWMRGENNRLTVLLPAGTQGELHIWFEGKTIWRVADVISLLSALGLTGYVLRKRR